MKRFSNDEVAERIFERIEETLWEILDITFHEAPEVKIKLYLPDEIEIDGKIYPSKGASYERTEK